MSLHPFRCNVCGRQTALPPAVFHREGGQCPSCGSNVRYRGLMHALATELFQSALALPDFPVVKALVAVGLSDEACYAERLARCFSYTNYFFHRAPFLDITRADPAVHESCDLLISSDVFEHVPPPRSAAFENAFRLLKRGGLLLLSVPYTRLPRTVEYFPRLRNYHVVTCQDHPVLVNLTAEDAIECFDQLFWHGGVGATLELRAFAKDDLLHLLERAGFRNVGIHDADVPAFGVIHRDQDHSFVITARKPADGSGVPAPPDDNRYLYRPDERVEHPQVHYPRRLEGAHVIDLLRSLERELSAGRGVARELQALYASASWRLTAPLRRLRTMARRPR